MRLTWYVPHVSLAPTDQRAAPPAWLVWTALIIVYVVWGSTYLAIRHVVESMPPFLAAGVRFAVAGAIMAVVLVLRSGPSRMRVTWQQLRGAAVVGALLLFIGNGFVSMGETTVPSGLAALIVGIVPVIVLVLRRATGERISAVGMGGVVLGFIGLGVLVVPRGLSGQTDLLGMLMILFASTSWASGSFMSRRLHLPTDSLVSTAYQLLCGGGMLIAAGLIDGEWSQVQGATFTDSSIISLLYLITFGSLLGYTAYTWLLQNAPIARVATYAYVNPVVAVALGFLIDKDAVDPLMLIGAAMIVASVAFIVATESRGHAT